jgi:arsenate reductase (thioredoxin)
MVNVLFLCTHNSARSVIAEVLLNTLGKGKFTGFSAGSSPKTDINPIAREIAQEMRYDTKKLYSKSWDEFAKPNAPKMHIVITVCDSAAKRCALFGQVILYKFTGDLKTHPLLRVIK